MAYLSNLSFHHFCLFDKYECHLVANLSHSDLVVTAPEVAKTDHANILVSLFYLLIKNIYFQ